jgi:hypothetical protein
LVSKIGGWAVRWNCKRVPVVKLSSRALCECYV